MPGVPFDDASGTIPDSAGRVLDDAGEPIPGLYATGWIRRGPVGLIGSTKSDASEAIASMLVDFAEREEHGGGSATSSAADALCERLSHSVCWDGWLRIDAAERALGAERGRERTKIVNREELLEHAREMERAK